VTDCVHKLTKGSTGLDSVGGIRADRKIFCTRRLFLHALFRVADSHSGGTADRLDYQDQTCVRMVTVASRVASMPLLPLLVACEALCSVKPAFKHLQNVHKELYISPPAPSIESQPLAPAGAGALSVEPLGWNELGGRGSLFETLKEAIAGFTHTHPALHPALRACLDTDTKFWPQLDAKRKRGSLAVEAPR